MLWACRDRVSTLYRQEVMCLMLLEPWRESNVGRWVRRSSNPSSVTLSKAINMLLQQVRCLYLDGGSLLTLHTPDVDLTRLYSFSGGAGAQFPQQ